MSSDLSIRRGVTAMLSLVIVNQSVTLQQRLLAFHQSSNSVGLRRDHEFSISHGDRSLLQVTVICFSFFIAIGKRLRQFSG